MHGFFRERQIKVTLLLKLRERNIFNVYYAVNTRIFVVLYH